MNSRSLRLETLETRLTPATKGAAILPPPAVHTGAAQIVIVNHLPTNGSSNGGQSMSPAIGISLGNSGSSGSSNSGGSGVGTSTGDPVGPGPGN